MLDKKYFEEVMREQLEELGSARVTIFLHSGQQFSVYRIDKAFEGYVTLNVYPDDGVSDKSKEQRRKPGGTDEVFWDRVAIPYSTINYVWLSITEPDKGGRVGFAGFTEGQ